ALQLRHDKAEAPRTLIELEDDATGAPRFFWPAARDGPKLGEPPPIGFSARLSGWPKRAPGARLALRACPCIGPGPPPKKNRQQSAWPRAARAPCLVGSGCRRAPISHRAAPGARPPALLERDLLFRGRCLACLSGSLGATAVAFLFPGRRLHVDCSPVEALAPTPC
ncbi:unnamed protein product, partial [Amoebophrya sp. A120]